MDPAVGYAGITFSETSVFDEIFFVFIRILRSIIQRIASGGSFSDSTREPLKECP